jgi:co-chaperonin GroES (HSP10)
MEHIEQLEQRFSELAQEIYESGERRIRPTWPWVLVRVAPKEQKLGSLYLPDASGASGQNKPVWEGIVLAIWEPHWHYVKDKGENHEVYRKSDFEIGDRVLFPSFAGLPVNFLDETKYRLVREWTFDPGGGVMCKVHYEGDRKIKAALDEIFADLASVTLSGK